MGTGTKINVSCPSTPRDSEIRCPPSSDPVYRTFSQGGGVGLIQGLLALCGWQWQTDKKEGGFDGEARWGRECGALTVLNRDKK